MGDQNAMTAATQISLLEQHPLSAAFPAMPEQELEALSLDIEKNGQREPGVLFEGMVLDGWHRYLACQKAGRKFMCGDFSGDDPVGFVISKNLHRRHMTASQRAAAVVSATNWRSDGRFPTKDQGLSVNREPGARLTTNAEMAKAAEVSERTIKDAKAAHQAGLGDAVREGQVSAKDAARMAKGEAPAPQPRPKPAGDSEKLTAALKAEQEAHAETREKLHELGDVARELEDKLTTFEATELDEQQKAIADLQKKLRSRDAEIDRQRVQIRDLNNKCNALIQQVKLERKKNG